MNGKVKDQKWIKSFSIKTLGYQKIVLYYIVPFILKVYCYACVIIEN
jgi:hypothetical protein